MKILEIHYSTAWAGAERLVVDLCNELSYSQHVTLCTIIDDKLPGKAYYKKDLYDSVDYVNLGCKSGLHITALWRILKIIIKEKPDVVHAHCNLIAIILPSLLYRKCKFYHTIHTMPNSRAALNPRLKWLYNYIYKNRVFPITISNVCRDAFIDTYHFEPFEIDNGRSELKVSEALESVKEELQSLKLNQDDKIFIHVARCEPAKNQALLISAFRKFLKNGYHGILICIGANFDKDENKKLLLSFEKGMYWLGVKDNVADYLFCSNFFVLSSIREGMPISLLEALSFGVIPICTPIGGIPNVIIDKKYGYISKSLNVDDFFNSLVSAYLEENSFDKNVLKEYFNKNYSMRNCANSYLNCFNKYYYD